MYQIGCIKDGTNDTLGLIQRVALRQQATVVTAADENGAVADAGQRNPEESLAIEFVYDVDAALPDLAAARATPVKFLRDTDSSGSGAAATYLVESFDDVQANTEYRRVTVNCRRWLENGIPTADSGS